MAAASLLHVGVAEKKLRQSRSLDPGTLHGAMLPRIDPARGALELDHLQVYVEKHVAGLGLAARPPVRLDAVIQRNKRRLLLDDRDRAFTHTPASPRVTSPSSSMWYTLSLQSTMTGPPLPVISCLELATAWTNWRRVVAGSNVNNADLRARSSARTRWLSATSASSLGVARSLARCWLLWEMQYPRRVTFAPQVATLHVRPPRRDIAAF